MVPQAVLVQGIVKFFKDDGWGVLMSPEVPSDVWVHFSAIDATGFRALEAGDVVEFDVEEAKQDSFNYRATRVVFVRHGPAPTLRRIGGKVVVVPPETPEIPLTPRQRPAPASHRQP